MGTDSIIDCAREGVAGLTPNDSDRLSLVVAGLAYAAVTGVTLYAAGDMHRRASSKDPLEDCRDSGYGNRRVAPIPTVALDSFWTANLR
jgi:hypothetical protein